MQEFHEKVKESLAVFALELEEGDVSAHEPEPFDANHRNADVSLYQVFLPEGGRSREPDSFEPRRYTDHGNPGEFVLDMADIAVHRAVVR